MVHDSTISSVRNPTVKHVRRLQADRRYREREAVYVVEGTRWLEDVAELGVRPVQVFYTSSWMQIEAHADLLSRVGGEAIQVSESVMQAMSDMETSPGILATLSMKPQPLPPEPTLLVILDRIQTPGNLGTICRTAAAAGVDGVLLAPGCVDFYNPKVVRGAMGAHLRLPVLSTSWQEMIRHTAGMAVWLAAAGADTIYTEVDWRGRSALLIGSEARGAGDAAERLATGEIAIPMHAVTESLNAAMAAAVILFEAARQRRLVR